MSDHAPGNEPLGLHADSGQQARIHARLRKAEAEHGIRIVLAVESGSRAWGFPSPDSDYDVRFVYVRPMQHDLSLNVENQRDVIEYPITDETDINGWDLRKALRLLGATNPAIVEWLQSPITYLERGSFCSAARALLPVLYSRPRGMHHYRHMAAGNYRSYLQGEDVLLKKYFYVLRPLLAVRWIETRGTPPPMEFERLLALIEPGSPAHKAVQELRALKAVTSELGRGARVPALNEYIEAELARPLAVGATGDAGDSDPWAALNRLFMQALREGPDIGSGANGGDLHSG